MVNASEPRTRILDTAHLLFMLRGYELVGINEIIQKSGVAKATFYHNFPSKENLCTEWLHLEKKSSEAANQALLEQSSDPSIRIRLKYEQLHQHLLKYNYRGCPFSNTKVMAPDSESISELIISYKSISKLFWQRVATDANCDHRLGDALFLIYAGATTEAQNTASMEPLDVAILTSYALLKIK